MTGFILGGILAAVVFVYSLCKCSGLRGSEQKYYDQKGGETVVIELSEDLIEAASLMPISVAEELHRIGYDLGCHDGKVTEFAKERRK